MKIQNFMKMAQELMKNRSELKKLLKGLHFVQLSLKIEWISIFGFKYLP